MQCISKNKLNRLKNRSSNVRVLFLLCCISITSSGQASVDKITSSTPIQLLTPSTPIPESFLLDVGIPTFNDGLYLTDDDDLVFPEVRYAESIYFANQLAKVLETHQTRPEGKEVKRKNLEDKSKIKKEHKLTSL